MPIWGNTAASASYVKQLVFTACLRSSTTHRWTSATFSQCRFSGKTRSVHVKMRTQFRFLSFWFMEGTTSSFFHETHPWLRYSQFTNIWMCWRSNNRRHLISFQRSCTTLSAVVYLSQPGGRASRFTPFRHLTFNEGTASCLMRYESTTSALQPLCATNTCITQRYCLKQSQCCSNTNVNDCINSKINYNDLWYFNTLWQLCLLHQ